VDRHLRRRPDRRAGSDLDRSKCRFLFLSPQETGTLLRIRYAIDDSSGLHVTVERGAATRLAAVTARQANEVAVLV
jgi:hypothetical protein